MGTITYERASSPQTQREHKQTIEETGFANILRNRSQDRLSELQAIDQTERVENKLLRERSSGLTWKSSETTGAALCIT